MPQNEALNGSIGMAYRCHRLEHQRNPLLQLDYATRKDNAKRISIETRVKTGSSNPIGNRNGILRQATPPDLSIQII